MRDTLKRALAARLPAVRSHARMVPRGHEYRLTRRPGPGTRRGAVLLALCPSGPDGSVELPLIVRGDDGGPHGGQVALPGGTVTAGDSGPAATALREAQEEIGLHPQTPEVLGSLSDLYIDVSDYLVTPVVGWVADTDIWRRLRPDGFEVRAILRASLAALGSTEADRQVRARGLTLLSPSFLAGEAIVWGATAMMLRELLDILGEQPLQG